MSDWTFFISLAVIFLGGLWALAAFQDSIQFVPISEYAFTLQIWGN